MISLAKATEAAEVLAVQLDGLSADAINKAFRSKAKECHPDHHGNEHIQQWSRVSWAKEVLTRWVERNPPTFASDADVVLKGDCRVCDGSGRVRYGTGFSKMTMQCVYCRGEGSVTPLENDSD